MIDSITEQGAVKEDMVEAFWVLKDEDDGRGGVYPTVLGFLVPSFNNLFFTPDCGVKIYGYHEHEKGQGITLGERIEIPVDVVFKVINVRLFLTAVKEWASTISY